MESCDGFDSLSNEKRLEDDANVADVKLSLKVAGYSGYLVTVPRRRFAAKTMKFVYLSSTMDVNPVQLLRFVLRLGAEPWST